MTAGEAPTGRHEAVERHDLGRRLDPQRLPDHRDRLFRAACAMCSSREDAEDLVQETYVSVLKRPRFVRHDEDLAYLLRVLRNTWINSHRSRARQPPTVLLDETIDFAIDHRADPTMSVIEMRAIYQAVQQLTPPLRDTLVAVDIVGLSYKQAARALGTREGTIMSRLYRARAKIADHLDVTEQLSRVVD
jgi:RNA polymerase sigma-70 factor (ECF subfamily)